MRRVRAITKTWYTGEQIAFALPQAESGTPMAEVIRKMGITALTFYRWQKQFAGMGAAEIRRLKQLDDKNARIKRLLADLTLDETMLQDVLKREFWSPSLGAKSQAICRKPTASANGGHARQPASNAPRSATSSARIRRLSGACGSRNSRQPYPSPAQGIF